MTLPARYALLHSEFNGFLFAPIGAESDDIPISVLSALTRLGLDPWQEAARLAALPKALASRALAATIARLQGCAWSAAEVASIADSLVELLPNGTAFRGKDGGRQAASGARVTRPSGKITTSLWLLGAIATAALLWLARMIARLWLR